MRLLHKGARVIFLRTKGREAKRREETENEEKIQNIYTAEPPSQADTKHRDRRREKRGGRDKAQIARERERERGIGSVLRRRNKAEFDCCARDIVLDHATLFQFHSLEFLT